MSHKRAFLETFRRWEAIFKRRDSGNVEIERWIIAEYYDSLGHLSAEGFDVLTKRLKETCVFFPTIRECLDVIKPSGPHDWSHPFLGAPRLFRSTADVLALRPPTAVTRIAGPDEAA
jgi:hypothetical protein